MTTIKAHFDGKSIILDQLAELPVNEPLTLHVELGHKANVSVEDRLKAFDALADLAADGPGNADWSSDSIYSGTRDDPR